MGKECKIFGGEGGRNFRNERKWRNKGFSSYGERMEISFAGGISLKERGENTDPSSIRGQLWQPFKNIVGKLFLSSRNLGKGGK
jgi:hypothetical protein